MSGIDGWRAAMLATTDPDALLRANSGLPGPRANLELLSAAITECDAADFRRWVRDDAGPANANTPDEFLVICGVAGHGRLLSEGDANAAEVLRVAAGDSRWRVREACAIGLQTLGDADLARLAGLCTQWTRDGSLLELRAIVAALAEPQLLHDPAHTAHALALLERITMRLLAEPERRVDDARVLRQALGYAWSVIVVATPTAGKAAFERLLLVDDPDARWIARENLRKQRLRRLDAAWVEQWLARLT